MPSLGADMETGTLVEWRVRPGSRVRRGDIMALVETEKGIIDIESFEDGVVERLVVEPGARVPVGATLALFEGEPAPGARVSRATPAARARAATLGIELASVQGSGPEGAVTLEDVERSAIRAAAAPGAAAGPARDAVRHAIASSMSRSKREIPHYYLGLAMDFGRARSWLEARNTELPVPDRLLAPVLLIKAAARAAASSDGFNGHFGAHGFQPSKAVHVGVAIALRGGGLVAPAILDADRKPLPALMRDLKDLVARVRGGHVRGSEIGAATITVTSLGDEGVDVLYPVIHPPQVAIVGFGSVLERPWVAGDRIEPRPVMNLSLAADHRVTDGRLGARFLARIRDALSRPEEL
jgi:pyruvate dehydrogenase E2 component (dihydrolipoamide acetyltransferase)